MEYVSNFDKNSGVLTIIVSGEYKRPQDAKVLQKYMMEFGIENHCCKFLVNLKNAVLVGSTISIFETSTMPSDPNHNLLTSKIALVCERITED